MKKNIFIALIAAVVLCGFTSCEDATKGIATYYGVVLNQYTDAPLSGTSVKVTNGDKIHTTTTTAGDGSFSVEVRLAEINQDYYILVGDSRIGTKEVEFPSFGNGRFDVGIITIQGPTVPTVETAEVCNIKSKMATGGGKVVRSGGFSITKRGVCWNTSQYPTIANDHTEDGTGIGEFMSNLGNLQPRTTYYVRAYAENEQGVAYGNQVYFKTESGVPTVQTKLVRVDGKTTVFCEGNVIDKGDSPVTSRGICWGTSTPTVSDKKTSDGEGTGGFSTSVTIPDVHSQNLYFRAYATNGSGTAYGEAIMINHRNPYQLPTVEDGSMTWMVLPYDLDNAVMDSPGSSSNTAQIECQALEDYDYKDWDLPTISVLGLLYQYRGKIGGFTNQTYWSSSAKYSSFWYIDFSNGYTNYGGKGPAGVRPVRKY